MQVIATAGHVDHGKSALVRALTGMEPDRWAEERRRGLTIDLGFAWLTQPDGEQLAFVDVPGHERFVTNMLAGVGPVPAVLFVVAADGGWMPQSEEHLAAIDALGISHGLLAVSRSDLADPWPALRAASERIGQSSLGRVPAIPVSAVTGAGIPELRTALAELGGSLPAAPADAQVRLWVDRVFSITGSGTVVTGTLPSGTVRVGDELLLTPSGQPVRIRAIESLKEKVSQVSGVARVALNLRGTAPEQLARGVALIQPSGWMLTGTVDVRLAGPAGAWEGRRLPRQVAVHIGSSRTTAWVRSFGGPFARLSLARPLPLHVADRLLLRDPGAARLTRGLVQSATPNAWPGIAGAIVLDVCPPRPARRGAAAALRAELAGWPDRPAVADLLARHGLLRTAAVRAMGLAAPAAAAGHAVPAVVSRAGWLADPQHWSKLQEQLIRVVAEHLARDPLALGMPVEAARAALDLPDRQLVEALAAGTSEAGTRQRLIVAEGYIRSEAGSPAVASGEEQRRSAESQVAADGPALPPQVADAVRSLWAELAASPFRAPEAGRLRELGLDRKAIAAAARAGLLLRIAPDLVLAPGADVQAARVLAGLPQPFTTAEARQALGTTRRVAIPLLEYLDRAAVTQRLPDDRRRLTAHQAEVPSG